MSSISMTTRFINEIHYVNSYINIMELSFHIQYYGPVYTPQCTQSCIESHKFVLAPAPPHPGTLVW